jgi:hypothetical protein
LFSLRGQLLGSRRPMKEGNADRLLKVANLVAQGRLRQIQLISCLPKAAMFSYRNEGAKLANGWVYHRNLSIIPFSRIVYGISDQFNRSRYGDVISTRYGSGGLGRQTLSACSRSH